MDSFIFSINATVPIFAIMILGNIFKRIGIIDDHLHQSQTVLSSRSACHVLFFWIWLAQISGIILM